MWATILEWFPTNRLWVENWYISSLFRNSSRENEKDVRESRWGRGRTSASVQSQAKSHSNSTGNSGGINHSYPHVQQGSWGFHNCALLSHWLRKTDTWGACEQPGITWIIMNNSAHGILLLDLNFICPQTSE